MIQVDIPGRGELRIEHLVLDLNGTLAVDGALVPGVRERLRQLAGSLEIHVITADTFGSAREQLAGEPCRITVLEPGGHDLAKAELVERLGAEVTAAIGNGSNDARMLSSASLGIAVMLAEGVSGAALAAADVICAGIGDAFDLLLRSRRLTATLRV